jgi:signal peptidase I
MRNPLTKQLDRLPGPARVVADWAIGIAIAVAIVLAVRAWVVTPYAIPTASMEPTLHCSRSSNAKPSAPNSSVQPGQAPSSPKTDVSTYQCEGSRLLGHSFADRVLVNRFIFSFRSPRRGEIVVFKPPRMASIMCSDLNTSVLVKRIVGLPGDELVERRGVIYVNGKKLDEPYIKSDRRDVLSGIWHIGKNQYFFMGDNRKASCDSREWGTVPRDSLIGPVFMTYWPPQRISFR